MISNLMSNLILFPKKSADDFWYDLIWYFHIFSTSIRYSFQDGRWKDVKSPVSPGLGPAHRGSGVVTGAGRGRDPSGLLDRGLWELLQRRGALHCGRTALDGRCVEISDVGSQKNWATTVKWCKMCWNHLKSGKKGEVSFGCGHGFSILVVAGLDHSGYDNGDVKIFDLPGASVAGPSEPLTMAIRIAPPAEAWLRRTNTLRWDTNVRNGVCHLQFAGNWVAIFGAIWILYIYIYIYIYGYGSIPIETFLVGWTSIYQLFWRSLGTRVLTHPHIWFIINYMS